ncbi:MAG: glycosyltransferase family 4 protein [Butyrivibrio sp.]|nr:glycosyltransferase family 4 protein [Butyrivibrio sp.]
MPKAMILANSSTGIYDFRNELILGLMDEGFEVVVSVPDDKRVKEMQQEGCKVIHTDINRRGVNPVQDMALVRAYKKLFKEEKPDVVITYTIKPNIYGGYLCGRMKIPFVTTITGLGSTFERGGMILKLIVFMYKNALKKCSCLFFQNDENRRIFEEHGIRARKHVTVNGSGVSLEKHRFEEYPGHADDITRFLYIGRAMKEKGTDEYLSAAKALHDKYGDRVSFAAVGYCDDDYEDKIANAQKQGILKMSPYALEIHPYIREADAIVHPSYHEGMSNVLMEAAATGRPVIASNISGCKEIVDDGVTGILFKPRDDKALIEALDRFMQMDMDKRKAMGKAARSYVEQKFDRRSIILEYINEILTILNNK